MNDSTINFTFGQTTFYDFNVNVIATKDVFINNLKSMLDSN